MKELLLVILLFFSGTSFAQGTEMLVCSQYDEIAEKINGINTTDWCKNRKSLELEINNVIPIVLDHFDEQTIDGIMLDNTRNPNWLAQKGIYDLREHQLCLENICEKLWNACNTGKNYIADNEQARWCSSSMDNIFEIQKVKVQTAVLENQERKTRSTQREKFRAMEVRSAQYFSSNIISFASEFKRFTQKVTAFILNPLQ